MFSIEKNKKFFSMVISIISGFFRIIFSVPFILAAFAWIGYSLFYNRYRKSFFKLCESWGIGSVSFLVYIFLYCFIPSLLIGFFVYFFMPFLMGGQKLPCFNFMVFVSIVKLSFFVTAIAVLATVHPKIKKLNIRYTSFFESVYILFFLRLYIDCAYCVIQPGIFITEQYGRFHPPLWVYILSVGLTFFMEKNLFNLLKNFVRQKKFVFHIKGVATRLIPLIIISQSVAVSFDDLSYETGIDGTDPVNMPSLSVIFQSYFVQEILCRYSNRKMGYILADCILSESGKPEIVTERKYSRITLSPIGINDKVK